MDYRNHSGHNKCIAKSMLCAIISVTEDKNCACTQNSQNICESMTILNEHQDVRQIRSLSCSPSRKQLYIDLSILTG